MLSTREVNRILKLPINDWLNDNFWSEKSNVNQILNLMIKEILDLNLSSMIVKPANLSDMDTEFLSRFSFMAYLCSHDRVIKLNNQNLRYGKSLSQIQSWANDARELSIRRGEAKAEHLWMAADFKKSIFDYAEALSLSEKAIRKNSQFLPSYNTAAWCIVNMNSKLLETNNHKNTPSIMHNYKKSLSYYEKYKNFPKKNSSHMLLLVHIYTGLERYKEATMVLDQVIDLSKQIDRNPEKTKRYIDWKQNVVALMQSKH